MLEEHRAYPQERQGDERRGPAAAPGVPPEGGEETEADEQAEGAEGRIAAAGHRRPGPHRQGEDQGERLVGEGLEDLAERRLGGETDRRRLVPPERAGMEEPRDMEGEGERGERARDDPFELLELLRHHG